MPDQVIVPWEKPNRIIVLLTAALCLVLGYSIGISMAIFRAETTSSAVAAHPPAQNNQLFASTDDDPFLGAPLAPITIIEFSDYQCPFCKRFKETTLQELLARFEGKIRFVYRDFPLSSTHSYAQKAAEASECADDQGKFWPMHDRLFAEQTQWSADGKALESFKAYASDLGLDTTAFNACLDAGARQQEVLDDYQEGLRLGITGTPTLFINQRKVVGAVSFAYLETLINQELAAIQQVP